MTGVGSDPSLHTNPSQQQAMSIPDHWEFIRSRISMDGRRGRHRIPVHAAVVELEERLSAVEDAVMGLEQLVLKQLVAQQQVDDHQASRLLPPDLQFALRLYQLLEEFNAELIYTCNDDGIHASVGNDAILNNAGFFTRADLRQLVMKELEGQSDG
jgi:hypothetical protein